MSLYVLPDEILLKIFNYLDEYFLLQLACVCKRFNPIISEILNKRSKNLLVTNQESETFRKRCKPLLLSGISKYLTHYNWINGKCSKINKIYDSSKDIDLYGYLSTMGLEIFQNKLLFFRSLILLAYDRAENGTVKKYKKDMAIQCCNSIITDIACCNNVIISAHADGGIRHWRIESKDNKNYFQLLKVHSNVHDGVVESISATSQYIASGSRRGEIKIQKNTHDQDAEENKILYSERGNLVETIKFDPTGKILAANITQFCASPLYMIYDINKSQWIKTYADKYKCSQLLWEDPHTILACYKKYIKKMDMRTPKPVVRTWKARFDKRSDLYSMSSDNLYTIMTGTWNNLVVLWDQRKSSHMRIYDISDFEDPKSEVWQSKLIRSVEFDSCHLYTAQYDYLYELDFKGDLDL